MALPRLIKIDNQFARDTTTMAIINTDSSYYDTIVANRQQSSTIKEVQLQVESLRNEFSEIKTMLLQIIGNKNG
jgi:hypothetical protein